jgi:hypothetical protein
MTYNSEVTYLDTFISLYKAKKRASTNDKEVDLFNFIDKTPIENLIYFRYFSVLCLKMDILKHSVFDCFYNIQNMVLF